MFLYFNQFQYPPYVTAQLSFVNDSSVVNYGGFCFEIINILKSIYNFT